MNENELQKSDSENEFLSAEDQKLRQMLCNLKKVNAPKNFDFHLKAKLAKANPEDFQTTSLLPFLRYFLPFSVVILLAVFVGFNIFLTTEKNPNSELAMSENQPLRLPQNLSADSPKTENPIGSANFLPTQANFSAAANNSAKKIVNSDSAQIAANKKDTASKAKNADDQVFTRESALASSEVLTPKGITLSPIFESAKTSDEKAANSIKQIFAFIGINANLEADKWKVTAVDANNMAARAGVKIGDFIEAIDGIKLSENSIASRNFNVKVIQIIRNGKNISLELNR